jgi:hypothetical protein
MTRTKNPNGTYRYTQPDGTVFLKASKRCYDQAQEYQIPPCFAYPEGTTMYTMGKTVVSGYREYHTRSVPVTEA